MNVFETHAQIVDDYAKYIQSFINIADPIIRQVVQSELLRGKLWPQPLLQFNPAYEQAGSVETVAKSGLLHSDVTGIFKGYSLYQDYEKQLMNHDMLMAYHRIVAEKEKDYDPESESPAPNE